MQLRDIKTIHHDRRTLMDIFNGETVWVKYAVVPRRLHSRIFFNLLSDAVNTPALHSTHNPDGAAALRTEASRLREMEGKGYLVPRIYEQHEKYMVLSDIGTCLATAIENAPTTGQRRDLFRKTASHLATMHANRDYHGRARTKDMTVMDGRIGMIDLEHEPLKVMPLADAQARDLWYTFFDAARYHAQDPRLLPDMLDAYIKNGPKDATDSLRKTLATMTPVTSAIGAALRILRKDHYARKVAQMNSTVFSLLR